MTTSTESTDVTSSEHRTLSGSLGTAAIVFMVIAAAAPLTVMAGIIPVGLQVSGIGFPSMFIIGALVLALFAVGLTTMSRFVARPGGFFTFVAHGLGRVAGVATAYLALLCYTAVQFAVFAYFGAVLSATIAGLTGATIPWWVFSIVLVAIVGVLGYRRIELSSRVLGVLLVCEIGIILVFSIVVVATGGADGLSAASFAPANIVAGLPALGLLFALASFIGFESTVVFRAEARNPERTIPRATYIAVGVIGLFYAIGSWAVIQALGPDGAVKAATDHAATMLGDTVGRYLGSVGLVLTNTLVLTSMFASVLGLHVVLARYQHSMSRVSLLPSPISRVHGRHRSPHVAAVVQASTAGGLLIVSALIGADPILIFTWFAGVATLAIVVLMALTCISVIVFFVRNHYKVGVWQRAIAPGLAFIALLATTVVIVQNFPLLIAGDFALSATLLAVTAAFPLFGLVQALIVRKRNPQVYADITETLAE